MRLCVHLFYRTVFRQMMKPLLQQGGVASKNSPVKRASYPKAFCRYKFNMYDAMNVMKYITNAE